MPNIDYLQIFRDAWKITWKNRFLWWFGFLIALPKIFNPQYLPSTEKNSSFELAWKKISPEFSLEEIDFLTFFQANKSLIFLVAGIILLLSVVVIVLHLLGRVALIKSTQHILRSEPTNLKTGFQEGKRYFGKIFAILFFSTLAITGCFLILSIPILILIGTQKYLSAILLGFLAIAILIPLVILYKYIGIYACYYVVLANLRPWLAVENAYAILKKNFFPSIIMSLLFFPFGILTFLVFVFLVTTFVLFVPLGFLLHASLQKTGLILAVSLGIPFFLSLFCLFSSIANAFYEVVWILFFYKIAGPRKDAAKNETISIEKQMKRTEIQTPEGVKTVQESQKL